jgi:hypothetical protein
MTTPAVISLPPYLRDTRNEGVFHFFNLEMAKNPFLVPHWDPPEAIYGGLDRDDAAKRHAAACRNVAALHVTEAALLDVNTVRLAVATQHGIPEPEVAEIGSASRRRRRGQAPSLSVRTDPGALNPTPLVGSALPPDDNATITSESLPSTSPARRRARLQAAEAEANALGAV